MSEILKISNFLCIKNAEVHIRKINVIIGPQSSGKSVCAKLLFFFKTTFYDLMNNWNKFMNLEDFEIYQYKKFVDYFPFEYWNNSKFEIEYQYGSFHFKITRKSSRSNKLYFEYTKEIEDIFLKIDKKRKGFSFESDPSLIKSVIFEEVSKIFKSDEHLTKFQLYSPAERNLIPMMSTVFPSVSSINSIFSEYLRFYNDIKNEIYILEKEFHMKFQHLEAFNKIILPILGGKIIVENGRDYISTDARKIIISSASSGQQTFYTLGVILKALLFGKLKIDNGCTLYVEEPESHLFPDAQERVLKALMFFSKKSVNKNQLFITTHSPYILSLMNNFLQAGHMVESGVNKKKIGSIINEDFAIKPTEFSAYSIQDGVLRNIIDSETLLINAVIIDNTANNINNDFDNLLNLMKP